MDKLIQQDTQARIQALNPSKSFIVQAPAGSGKTELLTQRYLSLLVHAQRAPEEIIAVTFTRKAQSEMRHRIMSALKRAQGEPPQAPHELTTYELGQKVLARSESLGWDLLKNPNRLRVMTIDALAHHLVHRLPLLAQMGASPQLAVSPQGLYEKAIQNFLAVTQKDEVHKGYLKDLLWHLDNGLVKLEGLLAQLLGKRDQWLAHVYPFSQNPEEGLAYIKEAMHRVITKALSIVSDSLEDSLKSNLFFYLQKAAENVEHLPQKLKPLQEITSFPSSDIEDLPHWQTLCHWLLTDKGEIRKRITKSQGFLAPSSAKDKETKEELKQIKQAFESLLEHLREEGFAESLAPLIHLPDVDLTDDEHRLLRALFELLPLLVAHLKVVFKEKGEVDFIEVAEAALSALGHEDNPTDLALSLDYQIKHILIDEFQDTSVIQFQLFEKLMMGWNPGDGRTLFLVGDPQQSIYRFRGAEVGLFLRAKEQGIGNMALEFLQLRKNFRSQAHVVQWSNEVFAKLFPPQADISLGAVPLSESLAHHESDGSQVRVWGFEDKLQECSAIAQYVETHKDDGLSKAILVRARPHLGYLMPMLKALRVPFEASDIEPITTSMVITDLLSLTRAFTDFSDNLAWLSVLRAPWCGLSLQDIMSLCRDTHYPIVYENLHNLQIIDAFSKDGQQKIQRLRTILEPFEALLSRHELSSTIKALWLQLGGPASYDTLHVHKTNVFFDTLRDHSRGGHIPDWEAFELAVHQQFASTPSGANNALQLMTIHKAKGLEFDTVFLPFLEKRPRQSESELLLWQELPHPDGIDLLMAPAKGPDLSEDKLYHYLQGHISKKNALECARLLYVGATRAKSNLILTATFDKNDEGELKKPAASSFMGMLYPVIEDSIEMQDNQIIKVKDETSLFYLENNWQLPQTIHAYVKSSSTEAIQQEGEEQDLNRPQIVNPFEPQVGTLVHRMLEMIATDGIEHWQGKDLQSMLPAWQSALREMNIWQHDDIEKASNIILTSMDNALSDNKAHWILKEHREGACELELVHWQNKKMHKSVIDRTFVDEQDRRWIIDYKTVLYGEPDPQIYLGQLNHYARLFKKIESRDIILGLYFPYQNIWWEQAYDEKNIKEPIFMGE